MILRPARDADAEAVRALIAGVYSEYGLVFVREEETHLEEPCRFFRESGGELWVAEDETGLFASVGIWFVEEREAELKSLYVRSDRRRAGFGEQLVRRAIEHAQAGGKTSIRLWTDTRFEKAHRLYERLGFERFGERDLDDFNRSREYGMRLCLGESHSAA